tara:strand:+ start:1583 stop:2728 length:1146 start_codon:yes stop_codon:yes gene_type:complete
MAGLFQKTQEEYYQQSQSFTGDGSTKLFDLLTTHFPSIPSLKSDIRIFVNRQEIDVDNYSYSNPRITFSSNTNNTDVLESDGAPKDGFSIVVKERAASENFGTYQYVSLDDVVNNFLIAYVGENKVIPKVKRTDVLFHARRGLAEFSYDTLKSKKSQEVDVPPSLIIPLPHDYVNYVGLQLVDSQGIYKKLYPTRYTNNPTSILQDENYDYIFDDDGSALTKSPSETWDKFKESNNTGTETTQRSLNLSDDSDIEFRFNEGKRYGLSPEFAQDNGTFYIDEVQGRIHLSGDCSGHQLVINYISDTLGTDGEMQIHKFAEEALYKHIAYAIASTHTSVQPTYVALLKKERFAALRNAKIRLSNLKSEELAQIMRNKSKWIKR